MEVISMIEEQENNKKKSKLKEFADKTSAAAKKAVEEAKKFASEKAVPAIKKAGEEIKDFTENKVIATVKETSEATIKDVEKMAQEISRKKEEILTEEKMQEVLHTLYNRSVNGIANFSVPVKDLADEYIQNNPNIELAVKSLITDSILKCENSDFLANFGRLSTMMAALPVSMYVQLRMCSAIAVMGGFDIKSYSTQTMIFACLTGTAMGNIIKSSGVDIERKFTAEMLSEIPDEVMTKLDKNVVFKLMSKVGTKGIANIRRNVVLAGGVVSGGMDIANTKTAGKNACLIFIKNQIPADIEEGFIKQASFKETSQNVNDFLTEKEVKKQEMEIIKQEQDSIEERIKKVKYLHEQGLIDEDDYKQKIKELLSKI